MSNKRRKNIVKIIKNIRHNKNRQIRRLEKNVVSNIIELSVRNSLGITCI